ncbi:MAG TPA: hypothetical protein VHP58_06395 [Alphaproteobacteria bacterium]|nr:hypothetical protein [Alphaproteobacteria bacterium]
MAGSMLTLRQETNLPWHYWARPALVLIFAFVAANVLARHGMQLHWGWWLLVALAVANAVYEVIHIVVFWRTHREVDTNDALDGIMGISEVVGLWWFILFRHGLSIFMILLGAIVFALTFWLS